MSRLRAWGLACICVAVVFAVFSSHTGQEVPSLERWASRDLPVTRGLTVWLDAARIAEARKDRALPAVKDGSKLENWFDGSGHGNHVSQQDVAAQPRYLPTPGLHLVRFDGQSQFLRSTQAGRSFEDVTIFVVAAPHSNVGMFPGLLAMSATSKNDYQAGINIDQGGAPSTRLQTINVEGAGAGGQVNLLKEPAEFGSLLRVGLTSSATSEGITLYVNGKKQGTRRRENQRISMDELIIGARYFNNFGPPQVCSFGEADIAEVLVYDRVLPAEERLLVDQYLAKKYGHITKVSAPGRGGKPLVRVSPAPAVQILVPGFTVRQLPVSLQNINNVLYRSDGKLVALGYNGNISLLSDTDGDGLEDKVEVFWENKGSLRSPIGMALTPPNYALGRGVFVACKGKCSLLVDTDTDDRADKEIVLAQGWKELPHGVDALGIAVHPKDHSVYFGLGCMDYEDAYGAHKKDASPYTLKNERGSILRLSPDFKAREIIATGIRFPVGLRFNAAGDLFCTDQEGATWLPNGNPFDELLHIERGRHYGFPPRHPKHLPNVIDEPSLVDFGPQHQSTCGLCFNEPVNGGPTFGPGSWKGDAFVCGYSRGKLYRTKLLKTAEGYVAENQLFACVNMLTCDACVSPQGELVVACHSGGPDWGSGPTGTGRLYKISYVGKEIAQPVRVWTQTPQEVRVAFDRPLTPQQIAAFRSGIGIECGPYVAAGDRFESLWPGYKVVQDQQRAPRHELSIYSTQVTADGRTLILATAPHQSAMHYAVTLPDVTRPGPPLTTTFPQSGEIELQYTLHGVEANWSAGGDKSWSGWLPHLDLDVSRSLTQGSADHEELWAHTLRSGELTLRTSLDLHDMLRPPVQPGSRLEHVLAEETVTLTFTSPSPFSVRVGNPIPAQNNGGRFVLQLTSPATKRLPLEIQLAAYEGSPSLRLTWHTNEDPRQRPMPFPRFLMPWARRAEESIATPVTTTRPELVGGNWERGRGIFLSEAAACAKCHSYRGEGGRIGPDLSNLPHRDYDSVLRDVTEPSFAINPDFVTQVLTLNDGRVLTGTVRTDGDRLHIANDKGEVTTIGRSDVEEMKASKVSIMPQELPKQLGAAKLRDLLTFLLTDPPRMPNYGRGTPPEPRTRKEVEAVLAGSAAKAGATRAVNILLVAGRKDHGPGEHDYPAWQRVWKQLLSMADATTVTTADDWPSPDQLKTSDVLVFYQQGKWTPERAKDLDAFLARGGGAVYIHYAVDGDKDAPGFAQRIGLAWQGGQSRFRHGHLDLGFETGSKHPIGRNFDKLRLQDESYWRLTGDSQRVQVLATGREDGAAQPLFWTLEPSKGRVFVSIPGHFSWTFDDPLYRVLLLRGIAWVAKEPVDRFNALVYPGARVKE
jgi:putative heme-binding domain-containing protein